MRTDQGNVTSVVVTRRVKFKFSLQHHLSSLAKCCMETVFKDASTTPAVKLVPRLKFVRKMSLLGFSRLPVYNKCIFITQQCKSDWCIVNTGSVVDLPLSLDMHFLEM